MDIIILVLKFLSLVFGIAYGACVIGSLCHGLAVNVTKVYFMAVPVSTFIFLQWIL